MKLDEKQKDSLFKIFIFAVIQILLFNLYLIISAISGDFNWTVERLTSSSVGFFIQILDLLLFINGVIIFLYSTVFLILLIKS